MKNSVVFSLAYAAFVAAAPAPPHQKLDANGSPLVPSLAPRQAVATCNADNVLRDLRNKKFSSSASLFCSGYIQATSTPSTTITATVTVQTTETQTTVTTETTATVVAPGPTVTVQPASTEVCGTLGYGQRPYQIFGDYNGLYPTWGGCKAKCISSGGQSFAFYTGYACVCFNAPTSQYFGPRTDSIYSFYDATCASPVVPTCNAMGMVDPAQSGIQVFSDYMNNFPTIAACKAQCLAYTALSFSFSGPQESCRCFNARVNTYFSNGPNDYEYFSDIECDVATKKREISPLEARIPREQNLGCPAKVTGIPTYLQATYAPSRISSACSCFISSASAACTLTSTATFNAVTSTTVTMPATETDVSITTLTIPGPTVTVTAT